MNLFQYLKLSLDGLTFVQIFKKKTIRKGAFTHPIYAEVCTLFVEQKSYNLTYSIKHIVMGPHEVTVVAQLFLRRFISTLNIFLGFTQIFSLKKP